MSVNQSDIYYDMVIWSQAFFDDQITQIWYVNTYSLTTVSISTPLMSISYGAAHIYVLHNLGQLCCVVCTPPAVPKPSDTYRFNNHQGM